MLKNIRCANFRGFHLFEAPIDLVTAFLGPNSAGKTTALHAVRLACDALHQAIDADSTARLDPGDPNWIQVTTDTIADPARLLPLADWQALFVDQAVGEGVSLTINLQFELSDPLQELDIRLACARNGQLKMTVRVRADSARSLVDSMPPKSPKKGLRLTDFLREHAPIAVFIPPFYGTVKEEEYRSRATIDKLLGSGDQSHVVRNLVVGLDSIQFDQLNAFLEEMVGARLTTRTSQTEVQEVPRLLVNFRDSNGDIELSAAGAGLINLVALYTALSRWRQESAKRRVLFLLDEPEAHLHPRLQADSAERFGRLVTQDFAAQLLLATHSMDILNRLSTRGSLLIRCDRNATPSAIPLDKDDKLFEDLSEWVDLAPYTAINFLASRRVVFCEGDGDEKLLSLLGRLRFRNDPARAQRFNKWAILQVRGTGNTPVATLLSRLVRHDVVRARAQQESFRVVVVQDRDHHRQPGIRTESREGVSESTVVWGRHSIESLLLEPTLLATWVKALVGDAAPADLIGHIERALSDADQDTGLNDQAADQLMAKLIVSNIQGPDGGPLIGEQKAIHANRQARELVRTEPATWQRGKDRARFVLGRIREHIALPARNQFPADIMRLVQKTETSRISDQAAAIPADLMALFDLLTNS